MNTRTALCLVASIGILSGQTKEDPIPVLIDLAARKQAAGLVFYSPHEEMRAAGYYLGAFISADGLALVSLPAFSSDQEPTVETGDGKPLKMGTVLAILPEQNAALMKFNHRPEAFLPLAPADPALGELVVLMFLNPSTGGKQPPPPVIGPVLAKVKYLNSSRKILAFQYFLHIGSGLSMEQRHHISTGIAINARGELVGQCATPELYRGQTLIRVAPLTKPPDQIKELATKGTPLRLPLPEKDNPIDPASASPEMALMGRALTQRDTGKARTLASKVLAKYPESLGTKLLLSDHFSDPGDPAGPLLTLDDLPPADPADPNPAAAAARHICRARFYEASGKSIMEAKEYEIAAAFTPEDCPVARINLGVLHLEAGRLAEAEPYYRQAYPHASHVKFFLEQYEALLNKLGRFDESQRLTDRYWELEKIYGTTLGIRK